MILLLRMLIISLAITCTAFTFPKEKNIKEKSILKRARQNDKTSQYFRNQKIRALPFLYLMGIAPNGINPRRFDIPQKDLNILSEFEKAYKEASILLFPQTKDEKVLRKAYSKDLHIPHVLHFIWLGPQSFPEDSVKNVRSWAKKHPHWTIYFWTDSPTKPLPIPSMKRRLVTEYSFGELEKYIPKTENWGEKSDLMRYIILKNEGGIYVDHDCYCNKSFTNLVRFFDFITCLERPHYHSSVDTFVLPSNGLIAVKPRHPILKECIKRISEIWDSVEAKYIHDNHTEASMKRVLERTYDSFVFATLCKRQFDKKRKDLILPSVFFYSKKIFNKKTRDKLQKKGVIYSTHSYAGSWKPPKTKEEKEESRI